MNNQNEPCLDITLGKTFIKLVGTAHVSKKSKATVAQEINSQNYDCVAVELCDTRLEQMKNPGFVANSDIFGIIKAKKVSTFIIMLAMSAMQNRIAKNLGVELGLEMKEAVALANKNELGSRQSAPTTFEINTIIWIYSRRAIMKLAKRIPRKNSLKLNGIPLISYSIRAAINSCQFDEIFVSTEDKELKQIAVSEGIMVDDRPLKLAGDNVTKIEVVNEFLERRNYISTDDIITALLPTCPFRTHHHIKEAFDLFMKNDLPYLIGVTEYDFPIQLALKKEKDYVMSMVFKDGYKVTRSQNIEKRYHPNGAMYIANVGAFKKEKTFFSERVLTYPMEAIHSFDIDYPYQFEIAEILAKKMNKNEF